MANIGSIYACIAGDRRYGECIDVIASGTTVTVKLSQNSPIGGMDGPGGAHPFEEMNTVTLENPSGAELCKAVQRMLVKATTVKSYGKPTKNFCWFDPRLKVIAKGLSAAKAQLALAAYHAAGVQG